MKTEHNKTCLQILGSHLQRILNLVNIESSSNVIYADSYSLASKSAGVTTSSKECYRSIKSYSRNEPRIELIKRGLERAIRFGEFHNNGNNLSINGFRLQDLKNWASYRPISASDAIGALSSECNCDCEFCHAKLLMAPTLAHFQLSLSEAKTRIKYYNPITRNGLPPITRLPLEPFSNKFSVDILKLIRKVSPYELITEETNGSFLTEKAISKLAELKPIFLIVSLNGVGDDSRRSRMREPNETSIHVAMKSPELLRKYKIPFALSYVPWPNRSLEEIRELAYFGESVDATRIRVCLPVTHRFAHPNIPYDMKKYWQEVLQYVQKLRSSFNIPIGTTPTIYEWQTIYPVVCGSVINSPGAKAGIRYGDIIIGIEGEKVITRREARKILADRAKNNTSTILNVLRDEEIIEIKIDHSNHISNEPYPYSELDPNMLPLGIDLPLDIGLTDIMMVKNVCDEYRGKTILLLLPDLALTPFSQVLSIISDFNDIELYLSSVEPTFYGDGWMPARWWIISDIAKAVEKWKIQTGLNAEVIILPAGVFSAGGQDILGGTILELEQQIDAEVCRVPMSSIIT